MPIYIFLTAAVIPLLINTILNIRIFIYVTHSSNRIQPQNLSATASNTNRHQQTRISRRDISLLKNMIFIFLMFIIGRTPTFIINIISFSNPVPFRLVISSIYLSNICILCIIIHLFLCNREVKDYLFHLIINSFHQQNRS